MREGIGKECELRRLLIFTDLDGSLLDKDGGADGSVAVDGAVGYVPLSLIAYTPDAPANHENAPIWD